MRMLKKTLNRVWVACVGGMSISAQAAQGDASADNAEQWVFLIVLGVAAAMIGYAVYKAHQRSAMSD